MEPLPDRMAMRIRSGYSPRARAASLSSSDGLVIPDVRKLDLEASIDADQEDEEGVCKICYAHRINCRLEPCGHSFTCLECGKYFVGRSCGLCRLQVDSAKRIRKMKKQSPCLKPEEGNEGNSPASEKRKKKKRSGSARRNKAVRSSSKEDTPA
jgi:hypothetical protein